MVKSSLKFRLAVSIGLLAIVSSLLLSQIASQLSRTQIERDQNALLREAGLRMTTQLSHDMDTRANEVRALASQDYMGDRSAPNARKQRAMERMRDAYPYYAWIGITDTGGKIIAGTDGALVGMSVAKRDWFLKGREGLYFGDAHDAFMLARLLPKPRWDDLPLRLVDVSAPVYDARGELIGVVCGHLSLDWAFEVRESMLDKLSRDKIDLIVLNREGKVLMGTPKLPSLKADLSPLNAFKGLAATNSLVSAETWPDGKRYLTASIRDTGFRNYHGMGWVVIARTDERTAFAPAQELSRWILLGGLLTGLAFTAILWVMLTRSLRPLEAIAAAAGRIGDNDALTTIPQPSGSDEVAQFARSLTQLVARLQDRNAELRLASRVFEESSQGIQIADSKTRILRVNRAFTHITGYTADETVGKNPSMLKSGMQNSAFYRSMWNSILNNGRWQGEIWNRNKNGHLYPEWLNINTLTDEHGAVTHYIGIFDDITEKKDYERRLVHLANYDQLTDLPNRYLMQRRVDEMLNAARDDKQRVALLFIDLDNFKNINDTLGHVAGDRVLKEVALRFASHVAEADLLSRWGGDEFVVAVADADNGKAASTATRLIECLYPPFQIQDRAYHLGASIGIALFPANGNSVDDLLRCADTAMYQAKALGANRYQLYEGIMNAGTERFLKIDSALRHSIRHGGLGLSLALQPQFSADGATIEGVEALARWNHPELGALAPDEFIPVAEENGQIHLLGKWVIEEACRCYARIVTAGCPPVRIAVNCSADQLRDDHLADYLSSACTRFGVPPGSLVIEVTETAVMSDEIKCINMLAKLRAMGHRLSIDDFGTGYSALNYVQKIRPSQIKVDKSFVNDMVENTDSRNIVAFTLSLAQSMGVDVVAEGVETEDQREMLQRMGSVKMQGFLLGHPMSVDDLVDLLQSRAPVRRADLIAN